MIQLKEYQQSIVYSAINNLNGACLFLDMGLGKSIVALEILHQLMKYKILIIAPLNVCRYTWTNEIKKFNKNNYDINVVCGEFKSVNEYSYTLINFEKVTKYKDLISIQNFDAIIIDESTRVKNPKTQIGKTLLKITRANRNAFVMCLTGTPAPERLHDLWSQISMVDRGESLGASYYSFLSKWFYKGGFRGYEWLPRHNAKEEIVDKVKNFCYIVERKDTNINNQCEHINVEFEMLEVEKKAYQIVKRKYILNVDDEQVLSKTASETINKLSQISCGFVYTDAQETKYLVTQSSKDNYLLSLVEQLTKCIVVYYYEATKEKLLKLLSPYHVYEIDQEQDFAKCETGVLLLHTQSGAYGLNLQYCNNMIFYSLTYSLERYLQTLKRIDRIGQDKVCYYYYLINSEIDKVIKEKLNDKEVKALDIIRKMKESEERE